MKKTELIIIRHGETDYNLKKIYFGHSDIELNKKGLNESSQITNNLKPHNIDSIYSSDLKRCSYLANIFGQIKNIDVVLYEELREINFGLLEGISYEEALAKYDDKFTHWIDNYQTDTFIDVETFDSISKRVDSILKSILDDNRGKTVVIVTHSGIIRYLLSEYIAKNRDSYWNFNPKTGTVIKIDVYDESWILKSFN